MKRLFKNIMMTLAMLLLSSVSLFADGPKPESSMSNTFVVLMVIIIAFLALIIAILAQVVTGAALIKAEREKKEKQNDESKSSNTPAAVLTIILFFISLSLSAQDKAATTVNNSTNGLDPLAYYAIIGVVFFEMIVIISLLFMLRTFLINEKKASLITEGVPAIPKESWWDKFNKFKPIHQEANIDLGHNYDGIRELDNRLPPWWLYGFYLTIVFACIYLYRYHVSHSAPLPKEEYEIAVAQADVEKMAYLKKAANNVDENTVKLLTDKTSMDAGKKIFQTNCFACHGMMGEGGVGPNLTDNYWLHGGSVNDVFKTIKYGYAEKGMKSWKDDFSPVQIAQVASYVKSLQGTNPPNGKAPQGTEYKAEQMNNNKTDSVKKENTSSAMVEKKQA